MKKKLIALTLSASAILSMQASAAEPSYDFLEAGYGFYNGHSGYFDADQAYLSGSYQFEDSKIYMLGGISHENVRDFSISANTGYVGVGYKADLSQNVDVLTDASYFASRTGGSTVDGFVVSHGYKYSPSDKYDVAAKLNLRFYMDDFADDELGLVLEGTHALGQSDWRASASAEVTDFGQYYKLGLRRDF